MCTLSTWKPISYDFMLKLTIDVFDMPRPEYELDLNNGGIQGVVEEKFNLFCSLNRCKNIYYNLHV